MVEQQASPTRHAAATLYLLACLPFALGSTPPRVIDAKLLDQQTVIEIWPCQLFSVIASVTLEKPSTQDEWLQVIRASSEVVTIGGSEFRNRLSSLRGSNDAATFETIADNGPPVHTGTWKISFLLNMKNGTCLFLDPGEYQVGLHFGDGVARSFVVRVRPVPASDLDDVAKLGELDVLMFVSEPSNQRYNTKKVRDTLTELAETDSVYRPMASMALGVATAKTPILEDRGALRPTDRAAALYNLLDPFCKGESVTPLSNLACFEYAKSIAVLLDAEQDEQKRWQLIEKRDRIIGRLEGSPVAPELRRKLVQLK